MRFKPLLHSLAMLAAAQPTTEAIAEAPPKKVRETGTRARKAYRAMRQNRRAALRDRQRKRELSGAYTGPSVAVALAGEGSGRRSRRVKIDDTGRRSSGNLRRLW